MKSIVLEDVVEFTQVQFQYFLYIMYSISVQEEEKVTPSKFITTGPIVFLEGHRSGGRCFGPLDPLCFFHVRVRIIGWTCKAS